MERKDDTTDDSDGQGLPGFMIGIGRGVRGLSSEDLRGIENAHNTLGDPHKLAAFVVEHHAPNPLQAAIEGAITNHGEWLTRKFNTEKDKILKVHEMYEQKMTDLKMDNERLKDESRASHEWFANLEKLALEADAAKDDIKKVLTLHPQMDDGIQLLATVNPDIQLKAGNLRKAIKAMDAVLGAILTGAPL
jgi:hypothetical protein